MEFSMKQVIETMKANGLHDEAVSVGLVIEQRAELLKACKKIDELDPHKDSTGDWMIALGEVSQAIANAKK